MSSGIGVGETIAGKYRVEAVLGEGGMGVVFAAHHLDLGRLVAIKVMRPEIGVDDCTAQRLMFEARAAARIQSEHVCRVLDVSRLEDGVPFIVMEYLQGENLGSVLERKGMLEETKAADYVLQACEPLAEAHAAGVIHRDLKPENLFLARRADGSSIVKVLDFGVSKATAASTLQAHAAVTRANAAIGSPYYMAPEQMAAQPSLDHRADIWALGAILYQLTTGQVPFDGDTLPEVCVAVLRAEPVPPRQRRPGLSEHFEQIILRCLKADREQRFTSVAHLAQALAASSGTEASTMAERVSRILRQGGEPPASSEPLTLVHPDLQPTDGAPASDAQPSPPLAVSGRTFSASFGLSHSAGPHPAPSRRRATALAVGGSVAVASALLLALMVRSTSMSPPTAPATAAANVAQAPSFDATVRTPPRAVEPAAKRSEPAAHVEPQDLPRLHATARDTPAAPPVGKPTTTDTRAGSSGWRPRPAPDPRPLDAGTGADRRTAAAPPPEPSKTPRVNDAYNPDNFGGRR